MTEFEHQIEEALVHALTLGAPTAEPAIRFVAHKLMPRVAAAIHALVIRRRGDMVAAEWPGTQAGDYAAALAALRGDT